jgi:hypothetical protein
MHKNTKMEVGSVEGKVAKSESGNSIEEILAGNKVTGLINVGTFAYNVKYKCEHQLKRREPVLERD